MNGRGHVYLDFVELWLSQISERKHFIRGSPIPGAADAPRRPEDADLKPEPLVEPHHAFGCLI